MRPVLVAMVSAKSSPGVSTLGLGLAARWPRGEAVVVEADPAGGDLSARFGMAHDPGLAAMALAARHGAQQPDPSGWLRRLPCGVEAVLAAPGAAAAASLTALGPRGGELLRVLGTGRGAVVVDAGRWWPDSPATGLVAACDVVLVVARPRLDEVRQCQARIPALAGHAREVRLLLVGEPAMWPAGEIASVVEVPLAGVVPVDRRGAGVLAGELVPRRGWGRDGWRSWTRLPLLRGCHSVARRLLSHADTPAPIAPAVIEAPPGRVGQPAGEIPPGRGAEVAR